MAFLCSNIRPQMRLVFDRHQEVLRAIWAAQVAHPSEGAFIARNNLSVDTFLLQMAGADVVGLEMDDKIAGGMYFIDGEVHLGILPKYRVRWRSALRPMLEHGFRRHGSPLLAKVGTYNRAAQRFVESVGCVKGSGNGLCMYYGAFQERMRYEFST